MSLQGFVTSSNFTEEVIQLGHIITLATFTLVLRQNIRKPLGSGLGGLRTGLEDL